MNTHPFLTNHFFIPWSQLTAERIVDDITHALELAEQRIQAISSTSLSDVTFANSFQALEVATEELDHGWGRLNHLDSVSDNPEQRAKLNEMLPKVSAFYASIPLNDGLWNVLKTFRDSDAFKNLSAIEQRFVEETCASFVSSGADLPADKKKRIAEISAELSEATQKYGENVLDSTNAWEKIVADEATLDGLPASSKAAAFADAKAKGHATDESPKWRFSLQMPSMLPVMMHAQSEAFRKEVWEASAAVAATGAFDNTNLVWKILDLREEKARLLGFNNFADLVLERRMAKNGATALKFTEDLHTKIHSAFIDDYQSLITYKEARSEDTSKALAPWEVAYWSEKRRKEEYDFDEEALRPYFPVTKVMAGMFTIASTLFGVEIVQRETIHYDKPSENNNADAVEVWHSEVTVYDLLDSESKEHLGSFYADWHPRESKRGGAWMNSLFTGKPTSNGIAREAHLGLIVGNMSPPIDGKDALLTHNEVETIFHEFGHLLHHLLSDVPIKSLAGTNVAWDFVELPSQLMENFCWDRESLDLFARHHETGDAIPDALFDKMIAARNYMSASAFMRQLAFGKLDLELHSHLAKYREQSLDEIDRGILHDYKMPLSVETPSMVRRFGHLFSNPTGYAAGYYSYKWAEVLDADAFTRFQNEGVLNPETGRSLRKEILSKGNSAAPDQLFRNFMGRDQSLTALLERSGLA